VSDVECASEQEYSVESLSSATLSVNDDDLYTAAVLLLLVIMITRTHQEMR